MVPRKVCHAENENPFSLNFTRENYHYKICSNRKDPYMEKFNFEIVYLDNKAKEDVVKVSHFFAMDTVKE